MPWRSCVDPKGLIGDRKASDLAPVQRPWTARANVVDSGSSVVKTRRSGCPGGHASAPRGLISDRKASDLAPALSSATGSANCGLHVMVKHARDRQFEYLNAQQEALEDKNGDEYWSNPQRRHDPDELLDLVPMRHGAETETIDSDEILMSINITGPAHLQRCIRNLCSKYIDVFPPTVKIEPTRVPPLSMKVALDKWKKEEPAISTFPDEGQRC